MMYVIYGMDGHDYMWVKFGVFRKGKYIRSVYVKVGGNMSLLIIYICVFFILMFQYDEHTPFNETYQYGA